MILLLPLAGPAAAQQLLPQRIEQFLTEITLHADGTADVTETITLVGDRAGINLFRDLPRSGANNTSRFNTVATDVLEATRDNAAAEFAVAASGNSLRVRFTPLVLQPGRYVYRLRYRVPRQIDPATGAFRFIVARNIYTLVDRAEVRLTAAAPLQLTANASLSRARAGRRGDQWFWQIERPLVPLQPLLLTVQADPATLAGGTAGLHGLTPLQWALGLAALLGGYYLIAWLLIGRDPPLPAAPARIEPPNGLSAPELGYFYDLRFTHFAYTAALIDLAVRGHLRITSKSGVPALVAAPGREELPTVERPLPGELKLGSEPLYLVKDNHEVIGGAHAGLRRRIRDVHGSRYFSNHLVWSSAGMLVAIAIACLLFYNILITQSDAGLSAALLGYLVGAITAAIGGTLLVLGRTAERVGREFYTGAIVLAAGFAVALMLAIWDAGFAAQVLGPLAISFALVTLAIAAFVFLRAPTVEGQRLRAGVKRFRDFLAGEETGAGSQRSPSFDQFERFLPHAVALSAATGWARKFAKAAPAGEPSLAWFEDGEGGNRGLVGIAAYLENEFADIVGNATVPETPD